MRRTIRLLGIGLVALVIAVAGAYGFRALGSRVNGNEGSEVPLAAAIQTHRVNGETRLSISKDAVAAGGIEIDHLKSINFQKRADGLGTVVQPQTLLDQRRTYQTAAADVARAEITSGAAGVELQRQQALHRDQAATTKALEAAQVAAGTYNTNLQLARTQLQLQEATLKQQWGPILADWLISGSAQLDRLLSGKDLLVQVALPTGQHVTDPRVVQIELTSGDRLDAKIVSSVPLADPKFQAQSFYAVLAASARLLPGMTVSSTIPIGSPVTGVEIPNAAVVRWQGKLYAFAEIASGEFARRPITTDVPTPDGWLVNSGFSAGTGVVVRGAQLLLSQEMKIQSSGGE